MRRPSSKIAISVPQPPGYLQSLDLRFSEEDTAIDYFGEQLKAAGYNYYGNEPMYSGITGQEFAADIYIGVVYYQRLRHMVLDKFQVRTTGPIDPLTRQPVKVRALFDCRHEKLRSPGKNQITPVRHPRKGTKAGGWHPIRGDGARCAYCARDLFSASRSVDELFRLLNRVGLQNMWEHDLPRV